jgi:ATP-dependent helicase/nuclease subunit A
MDEIANEARSLTPFAFYARLLGARGGRKRIVERLGPEANDALDEFLNLALDYESRETPSLQGFAAWLRTASAEVKRDMEISRDEVRVMTVHGAKGLEAPIVILADTTTPPEGPNQFQPRLLALNGDGRAPKRLVWVPTKRNDTAIVATARTTTLGEARDEYRRLLYVAMTRAADRLIVCGSVGKQKMPDGCWYQLVEQALTATSELTEEPADFGEGMVCRFRKGTAELEPPLPDVPPTVLAPPPAWLTISMPEERRRKVITPSSDERPVHVVGGTGADRKAALLRGTLVHRLMQSLPDVAPARRAEAARTYLGRAGLDFSEADREGLLAQALAVLNEARFAPLFAPGSRAEVPIVGRLAAADGSPIAVSGQVDRLAVTDREVLIADFKTNRPAPTQLADVPPGYVQQLALYRVLLAKIYPGRAVRAAILWTDVPDLMELSSEAMDAKIADLTSW